MERIPLPGMNVYFVSREPVRSGEPLRAFAEVRAALEKAMPGVAIPGTLSASSQNRFAIAVCPTGLGQANESSICEVYEYDPVRYLAMVIGLVEPPQDTPVHWIARRVNPAARVVAVCSPPGLADGVKTQPFPKGYLGDPNTLLGVGKILKGNSLAVIERVGLVCPARNGRELAGALSKIIRSSK